MCCYTCCFNISTQVLFYFMTQGAPITYLWLHWLKGLRVGSSPVRDGNCYVGCLSLVLPDICRGMGCGVVAFLCQLKLNIAISNGHNYVAVMNMYCKKANTFCTPINLTRHAIGYRTIIVKELNTCCQIHIIVYIWYHLIPVYLITILLSLSLLSKQWKWL